MGEANRRTSTGRELVARAAVVGTVAALTAGSCGGLSEEELACEQAAGHLEHCCPELDLVIDCIETEDSGCGASCYDPGLPADESRRILGLSCARLLEDGYCARSYDPPETCDDYYGDPAW